MSVRIITGDCRDVLPTLAADSFDCVVTSPPYFGLRDYGVVGQIGLESTLAEYLETMVGVFRELRRALKPSGTAWLNIGDCYNGGGIGGGNGANTTLDGATNRRRQGDGRKSTNVYMLKSKDLCMVPNRLALLLQDDGWYVRSEIIWHKPNPMPESVLDRPTCSHEKVWLLAKSAKYFYDAVAIREAESVPDLDDGSRTFGGVNKHGANAGQQRTTGRVATQRKRGVPPRHAAYDSSDQSGLDEVGRGCGRNARNVWTIASEPYRGAHYAVMPSALAERCIKAGSPLGGSVLDPFGGAGTTGLVADRLGRRATLIELNPTNREMAADRVTMDGPLFAEVTT